MSVSNTMNESKAAQARNTWSHVWANKKAQRKETGQAGDNASPGAQ